MRNNRSTNSVRKSDPYLDRRSGDERRDVYDADYFENGGEDRRKKKDRRKGEDRRDNCVKSGKWTSICPE